MLQMLRTHKYRLVREADELEHRRKYREATGMKNPIPYIWKDTRQLIEAGSSLNDRLGTGKGEENLPCKTITPRTSGPDLGDHYDE